MKTTLTADMTNACDEYYVAKNRTMSELNTLRHATVFALIFAGPLLFFALCSAAYVIFFTDNTTDNITRWFARPSGLAVALILFSGLYLLIFFGVFISLDTPLLQLNPKFTILDDHEDCKSYDGFTVINT